MKKLVILVGFLALMTGATSFAADTRSIMPIIVSFLLSTSDAPEVCGNMKSPLISHQGGRYSESMDKIGDVDYIKIRVPNFYTELKIESTTELDLVGELFNSECESVAYNDAINYPTNLNFRLIRNLEPGVYYLGIDTYDSDDVLKKIGSYEVDSNVLKNYVYLSAKYSDPAQTLDAGADDPYHPEFGDPEYSMTQGIPDQYDSINESYYYTVDPDGLRTTLLDWKKLHGFVDEQGNERPLDPNNPEIAKAEYINAVDLGLGRKMSCMRHLDGAVIESKPCVVDNYTIGADPSNPTTPVFLASVAMELVRKGSIYYTAFFVFDRAGNRISSVDLDGSGAKKVPEVCWACHDGEMRAGFGAYSGLYLPFDVNLYKPFPGGPFPEGEELESQRDNFRRLNDHVRDLRYDLLAIPEIDSQIDNLINYWSGPPVVLPTPDENFLNFFNKPIKPIRHHDTSFTKKCVLCHTPRSDHISEISYLGGVRRAERDCSTCHADVNDKPGARGSFDHSAQSEFYARYCRVCHVSQSPQFKCETCHGVLEATDIVADNASMLRAVLCDEFNPVGVQMPNAKVTHLRFIQENLENSGGAYQVKNGSPLSNLNAALGNGRLCEDGEYPTQIFPKN